MVKLRPSIVIVTSEFNLVRTLFHCYPRDLFSDWDSNPWAILGDSYQFLVIRFGERN